MKHWILTLAAVVSLPLVSISAVAQSDSGRVAVRDSITYGWEEITAGWKWVSKNMGGDLFLSGETYGLHLSGDRSGTSGFGYGFELRFRTVLLGAILGICGNEGIHTLQRSNFSFSSLYVGMSMNGFRMELGEIYGDNNSWLDMSTAHQTYMSAFVGVSKWIGEVLFVEPTITLMFPVFTHYLDWPYPVGSMPPIEHYHFRDLFFSAGLKLGIGTK